MDERPDLDLGPDPHLNGRGVALTREQRRVLAVVAVLIGSGLVLALVGVSYGLPTGSGLAGAARSAPAEVVVDGAGTAVLQVEQDGRTSTARVTLPWTVPLDPAASSTSVEARLQGRDRGPGIACSVRDSSGAVLQQVRGAGDGAAVECTASGG